MFKSVRFVRLLRSSGIALLLAAALTGLSQAASTTSAGPPPDLAITTVNDGPGDQTDPHVSGNWISYTSELNGALEIRVHNIVTGVDEAVPTNSGYDFLSDISGTMVVYTHLTNVSSIYAYNISSGGPPIELDPSSSPTDRREARIGNQTVVWQDFSYNSSANAPELVVYDFASGAAMRLTTDVLLDRDPAVSPDGNVIVWTKCQQDGTGCRIWEAMRSVSGWTSQQLTFDGEAGQPDTDGTIVTYSVVRDVNGATDEDVFWQPVGGGTAQVLAYDDRQTDPKVSQGVISFEGFDNTASVPNFDIFTYDTATGTLYRLTQTPQDETLNDVSVGSGVDRPTVMVWTREDADYNVYAATFEASPPVDDKGPFTSDVVADPNPAPVNTTSTLTATIDDSTTGGSLVASAQYSLDGGSWEAMSDGDGAFDSATEGVSALLPAQSSPGVHDLCVRGTDSQGNTGDAACIQFVIYDPTGGFTTGGGWIDSPSGACQDASVCQDASGKAAFGFVSKYEKGANVPSGDTKFDFKAGGLEFASSSYDWLVVNQAGTNAQFKGSGTVNGVSGYQFMLWASAGSPDTFRIQISDGAGDVVYDNGTNQAIGGGSIIVHQ